MNFRVVCREVVRIGDERWKKGILGVLRILKEILM
jgi:hypothetical protein